MTLVVSEVSKLGIAMAADSAITEEYPPNWTLNSGGPVPPVVRIGAQKTVPVEAINGGISVWGFGTVGMPNDLDAQIPIDRFLLDFANSVDPAESLEDVGNRLADTINSRIRIGQVRGGFHLAGYAQQSGKCFPALYHIHTGPTPEGPHEPLRLHRDLPFSKFPDIDSWLNKLETTIYWLRNGTYDVYALFSESLNKLMDDLRQKNFICPDESRFKTRLEARGRFLKLQIQRICEFYRLSNQLEIIARPISWLTISPEGIEHFEPIVI